MDEEILEQGEEPVEEPVKKSKKKEERTIEVKKGDDLIKLAMEHLGDPMRFTEIRELNGLGSTRIYVGQILKLPEK